MVQWIFITKGSTFQQRTRLLRKRERSSLFTRSSTSCRNLSAAPGCAGQHSSLKIKLQCDFCLHMFTYANYFAGEKNTTKHSPISGTVAEVHGLDGPAGIFSLSISFWCEHSSIRFVTRCLGNIKQISKWDLQIFHSYSRHNL